MLSWMVNKYVQFVKYNLFIAFMLCMLCKYSKRTVPQHWPDSGKTAVAKLVM